LPKELFNFFDANEFCFLVPKIDFCEESARNMVQNDKISQKIYHKE
jgi:hypothetical protein